jgi:hypothetical protein
LIKRGNSQSPQVWSGSRILEERVQFVVGFKLKGKHEHRVVSAEDGLIAALKVKAERPECAITYVRRQNRRGDARHPSNVLAGAAAAETQA